eukprot:5998001-Pyramimonas_sp.AAC.1
MKPKYLIHLRFPVIRRRPGVRSISSLEPKIVKDVPGAPPKVGRVAPFATCHRRPRARGSTSTVSPRRVARRWSAP